MKKPVAFQTIINKLDYDFAAFTLDHFVHHLEQLRRRAIIVGDVPFQAELFGLWFPEVTTDYIFVNSRVHPVHRTHIVLHELSHILLEHQTMPLDELLDAKILRELGIRGAQGHLRSRRTLKAPNNLEEKEAEVFVSLLHHEIVRAERFAELLGETTSLAYRRRFSRALDYGED